MRILLDDKLSGYGENDLLRDLDLLPAWRREQALRFKHFEGKRNCARAFLLLWECLKDKVDLERPQDFPEFVYNEHGKPSLDPSLLISNFSLLTFNFSLSHCKEAVVCITDNQPCGIDVESVGRYSESVARYAMNDEELNAIEAAANPARAFVRLWTQKEALLKAVGTGIQDNMRDIFAQYPDAVITTHDEPEKPYIMSFCTAPSPLPLGGVPL